MFYLITDLTESELGNFIMMHVLTYHLRCINLISYIDVKCKYDTMVPMILISQLMYSESAFLVHITVLGR